MLSTDTTWEVVQSFLNVPGMKGVALIDGRSRPYFKGIERVLNSQQRDALAQGVWQVLETIPDDFDAFEFQFAGTQVYIHKLSQELILLVLTHDHLNYPDYADAFGLLRQAFDQDKVETTEVFQRLLGSRNTKLSPVNLTEMANDSAAVALPDLPSGSADYSLAADTELTDVSIPAQAPDAPANPAPVAATEPDETLRPASSAVTQAGSLGDRTWEDAPWEAAAHGSSKDDSNDDPEDIWGGTSDEPAALPEIDLPPEPESLLAVTPVAPAAATEPAQASPRADKHEDLAALMDTLSLGEDDFDYPDRAEVEDSAAASASSPAEQPSQPRTSAPGAASERQPPAPETPVAPALEADDAWASEANALADALESSAAPFVAEDAVPAAPAPRLEPTPPLSASAVATTSRVDNGPAQASQVATPASAPAPDVAAAPAKPPVLAFPRDELDLDDIFGDDDDAEVGELLAVSPSSVAAAPALESYVDALNALGEFSTHYLGRAVIVNYWRTSRSGDDWLQAAFAIERSANSIRLSPDYAASRQSPVTPGQQALLQTWAAQFVDRCSRVIRDFPQLAQDSLEAEQVERLGLGL